MYSSDFIYIFFNCFAICVFAADDVRAEADHQQEGAGAADGHGQPGQLPEPAGAEQHVGRQPAQSDGPAGDLPAAPRPG